jgi:hypothetical protein
VDLKDVDPRLVDVPIYRFYRFNELHPADYSNWFGGNVKAGDREPDECRLCADAPWHVG